MTVYDSRQLDKDDTIRLNEIAEDAKDRYATAMDGYYEKYGVDPFWWILPLATRNVNYDDTFHKICLLELILEKAFSGEYERIVTDKGDIKKTLDRIFESRKISVRVDLITDSLSSGFRTRIIERVIRLMSRVNHAMRMSYVEGSLSSSQPDSINVLIWGPLLLNKIKGKDYEDGYFTELKKYCSEEFYYCPYLIYNTDDKWKSIIDKVNRVNTYDFIHMREYHRWYDYFSYIVYRRYCYRLKKKKYKWGDYDITPIICSSIDMELHRTDCSYAIMQYIATKRLVKSIPISKFILWYEARPVDIAISIAIRDSDRNIKRVGYIGYTMSEYMLGQSPTKGQVVNSIVPDTITTPGRYYERVIKRYAPQQRTAIVPSFRVQPIGEKKDCENSTHDIFMALTYFPSINYDMIRIINDFCNRRSGEDIRVLVKMHPTLAGKELKDFYSEKMFFEPEYTTDNIYDCLKRAYIAFTSSTSASMDAILSGTYLICLSYTGQLYFTCIAKGIGKDRYSIIFDGDDFEKAVDKGYDFYSNEKRSDLNSNDYFVPIRKEGFEELFS